MDMNTHAKLDNLLKSNGLEGISNMFSRVDVQQLFQNMYSPSMIGFVDPAYPVAKKAEIYCQLIHYDSNEEKVLYGDAAKWSSGTLHMFGRDSFGYCTSKHLELIAGTCGLADCAKESAYEVMDTLLHYPQSTRIISFIVSYIVRPNQFGKLTGRAEQRYYNNDKKYTICVFDQKSQWKLGRVNTNTSQVPQQQTSNHYQHVIGTGPMLLLHILLSSGYKVKQLYEKLLKAPDFKVLLPFVLNRILSQSNNFEASFIAITRKLLNALTEAKREFNKSAPATGKKNAKVPTGTNLSDPIKRTPNSNSNAKQQPPANKNNEANKNDNKKKNISNKTKASNNNQATKKSTPTPANKPVAVENKGTQQKKSTGKATENKPAKQNSNATTAKESSGSAKVAQPESNTNDTTIVGCWACNTTSSPLQACAACKTATYCSRNCQATHWKIHKPKCLELRKQQPK